MALSKDQKAILRACELSPEFFIENYVHIVHPSRGLVLFELRPAQRELLQSWRDEKWSLLLKTRQMGASTLFSAGLALWEALFLEHQFIAILSNKEESAVGTLAKAITAYEALPAWMQDALPQRLSKGTKSIDFLNGSAIKAYPSKSNPARSKSPTRVFFDEFAHFESNKDAALAAVEPAVETGGSLVICSTANGLDVFYDLCKSADDPNSKWDFRFYNWTADPDRTEEWYASQKANMPEWRLHQEYPRTKEEAFVRSGNPYFSIDHIEAQAVVEPMARGEVSSPAKGFGQFEQGKDETLKVWQWPHQFGQYTIGADVSMGVGQDWSVAVVIECHTGEVVASWRGQIDADRFGTEILAPLGWWYNSALQLVEAQGYGGTTLAALVRVGYTNLMKDQQVDRGKLEAKERLGWHQNARSKPIMLSELVAKLRDKQIVINDKDILDEMKRFRRVISQTGKESTEGSPHDDQVIALALANIARTQVHLTHGKVSTDFWNGPMTHEKWEQYVKTNSKPVQQGFRLGGYLGKHR